MKGKLEVDLINKSKDALIKSRLGTQDVFGFEGQSKLYSDYRYFIILQILIIFV